MKEMDFLREGFFPDLLCDPCILVSKCYIKTIMMYQADIPYKCVKLWNKESGVNATYFAPVLEEVECMSDKSQFNSIGNRIIRLVLDKDKIGTRAVFRIKGYEESCMVGRMDFVESLLRRKVEGIKLTEVGIAEDANMYEDEINIMSY